MTSARVSRTMEDMALPPGPKLPAAAQTLAYIARPLDFLAQWHRRYELDLVLSHVLARVRLRKARPTPARVALRGFTFVPADGAEVVVEARAA